jgi:hypothetical protein
MLDCFVLLLLNRFDRNISQRFILSAFYPYPTNQILRNFSGHTQVLLFRIAGMGISRRNLVGEIGLTRAIILIIVNDQIPTDTQERR